MKNSKLIIITYICIVITAFILHSCCGDDDRCAINNVRSKINVASKITDAICYQNAEDNCYEDECEGCIVKDRIIVLYKDSSVTEEEKEELRRLNGVSSYENCSCGDNRLELWKFNIDTEKEMVSVEILITQAPDKSGDSGVEGENEFLISLPEKTNLGSVGEVPGPPNLATGELYDFSTKGVLFNKSFVGENNGLNIAVIDTGIDYGYFDFSNPRLKLYNTELQSDCGDISGWDFYKNTKDVSDYNGHGTNVIKIMVDELLKKNKTNFNILPVKAFNNEGKGTYWNLLCAMSYINQFDDIHIINMSLGFTKTSDTYILEQLIKERENKSLIVASAGNYGVDNDKKGNEHYPSGYDFDNIIAVGGGGFYKKNEEDSIYKIHIAGYSNYGIESIDLLAKSYFDYRIYMGGYFTTQGTSFAAAKVSGRLGDFFNKNSTPQKMKEDFMNSTEISEDIKKYVKDGRFLPLTEEGNK